MSRTYYHGTTRWCWKRIQKEGLIPGHNGGRWPQSDPRYVYLAADPETAEIFSTSVHDQVILIVEPVETLALDTDENFCEDASYMHPGAIPPENIRRFYWREHRRGS